MTPITTQPVELSQFKIGLLEGIESILTDSPTDWRASGIMPLNRNPDWLPTTAMLAEFNEGIQAGFDLCKKAGLST